MGSATKTLTNLRNYSEQTKVSNIFGKKKYRFLHLFFVHAKVSMEVNLKVTNTELIMDTAHFYSTF